MNKTGSKLKLEVMNRIGIHSEGTWYVAEVPCEHCGRQGRKVAEEMTYEDAVDVARCLGVLNNDPGTEAF